MAPPVQTVVDFDTTSPDPGRYGPASIAWRVHHDPAALVGGLRALMLQALHPEVMRGFYGHTDVRDDPWGRLFRTAGYVNTVVFGTTAEAELAAHRVRSVHAALGLDQPDWLLWVHCGALDSWLVGHRRSGAPLRDDEADQFVAEHVTLAELTGIDGAVAPRTVADLAAYFVEVRPQLHMTPEAREAVLGLMWPPMDARMQFMTPARPLWTLAAASAYGLLPGWARTELALTGLPTLSSTAVPAGITARLLRTALLAIPQSRRTSPHVAAAKLRLQRRSDAAAA